MGGSWFCSTKMEFISLDDLACAASHGGSEVRDRNRRCRSSKSMRRERDY